MAGKMTRKRTKQPSTKLMPAARRQSAAEGHPLVRAFLAVSLDGYIADKDGGVDWLNPYFTPEIDFGAFMKTIGVTVLGRVTYDWAVAHGGAAAHFNGRTIVLTRRPIGDAPPGVEAWQGDVGALATQLRGELKGTGKDVWLMGGGKSIALFHEGGLVDRWELGIIPVLLGDGIPLFPRRGRGLEGLRLLHSRTLKNGIIEATYAAQ